MGGQLLAVELDRGSEDQAAWRAKVAAICACALGPYPQVFHTDNLTVAVVTPHVTRRDELRAWTARELAQRRLAHLNIFLFTCADPVTTPPPAFFFGTPGTRPGRAPRSHCLISPTRRLIGSAETTG